MHRHGLPLLWVNVEDGENLHRSSTASMSNGTTSAALTTISIASGCNACHSPESVSIESKMAVGSEYTDPALFDNFALKSNMHCFTSTLSSNGLPLLQ